MPKKSNKRRKTRHVGVSSIDGEPGWYELRKVIKNPKTGRPTDLRHLTQAPNPEAAARLRTEMIDDFLEQHLLEQPKRLADFAESWLDIKAPSLRPSTAEKYAICLEHIEPILGDHYVNRITVEDVARLRRTLSARYAPSTVNSHLSVLRSIMRASSRRYGFLDPTPEVALLPIEQTDKCLELHEVNAILEAMYEVAPQWFTLTFVLAMTGARWGEVTALRWEDIDFSARQILFRRSHWRGEVGPTKTGIKNEAALTDEMAEALQAHRQGQLRTQAPGFGDGWVFPSKHGTLRSAGVLTKPLRLACERAGIHKPVSAHWFRHTISRETRRRAGQKVQQAIVGHKSDRMSLHYDSVTLNERHEVMASIGKVLAPKMALDRLREGAQTEEVQ